MARITVVSFVLASICVLALFNAVAARKHHKISCQDAEAITVNGSLILGTWFEAARKPIGGGVNSAECVEMDIIYDYDNGEVSTQVTFSVNPNALWINQTVVNTIKNSSPSSNPEIFTAMFTSVSDEGVSITYKFLETDYSSYALICGYITEDNSVPATSSAAFIITRERQMSFTTLAQLTVNALAKYSAFEDISLVTQSSQCYQY